MELVLSQYHVFRPGCEKLFSVLESVNIPLLIFSAGLTGELQLI